MTYEYRVRHAMHQYETMGVTTENAPALYNRLYRSTRKSMRRTPRKILPLRFIQEEREGRYIALLALSALCKESKSLPIESYLTY